MNIKVKMFKNAAPERIYGITIWTTRTMLHYTIQNENVINDVYYLYAKRVRGSK